MYIKIADDTQEDIYDIKLMDKQKKYETNTTKGYTFRLLKYYYNKKMKCFYSRYTDFGEMSCKDILEEYSGGLKNELEYQY